MPPYMTNLILVFAGLLTGFLLWHRDRRNEDSLQRSLKKDNHDLHASLTLAHATHRQLSDRFKRQTSQLNVLQRLCDELNEASQNPAPVPNGDIQTTLAQNQLPEQLKSPTSESDAPSVDNKQIKLQATLDGAIAENLALHKRLENQEATINKINEQNKDALNEQELNHADQISHLEHRICNQAESIKKTDQHIQDLASKLDTSEKKQISAESALIDSNSQTSRLYKKIENLKATCLRISQFETHTQSIESENQKLKLENQNLQTQQEQHILSQNKLSVEFNDLKRESSQSKERLNLQKTKESELSKTIDSLTISNDQLRHERAELLARLANHQSMSESDSAILSFAKAMEQRKSQSQQYDAEHQGHLIEHAQRGMLFASPPKKPDNLKFISGITEILEARLNDCGIYTYQQILAWSDEEVVAFSSLLGISESLITKTWQQQADFLAQPKDGQIAA